MSKQRQMMPESYYEIVTVDKAKAYLERNNHNRPMNDDNLRGLIGLMESGQFMNTGESIKFDWDGNLIDGQHRLMAIVKTGKQQEMLIAKNLPPEAFAHIDTGRIRRAADILGIEGLSNPSKIAAMTKFIIAFERGQYLNAATHNMGRAKKLTNADVLSFVLKNKDSLYESYPYGYNKSNKVVSGNLLASFHYIFKKLDEQDADTFCHRIATGLDLKETNPIYVLRQHLTSDMRAKRKMPALQKIAFVCKAWNLFRQKKTVTSLRWDSISDPFPKPI